MSSLEHLDDKANQEQYENVPKGAHVSEDSPSDGNDKIAPELTPAEEKDLKKIYRKLDLLLLSSVTIIYWLNFLDRANIGNARAAGMQAQLGLSNYEYSICLTLTYVAFFLSEFPLVMLGKKYGFNWLLPTTCVAWGLACTFQGFVHNYAGLALARFFLGAAEGAILPGSVAYLSEFYRRKDLGFRTAFFFGAIALAGAFSGLLAAAIVNLDGKGGKAGWRWIFYIEGAMTVILGATFLLVLPRNIKTTRYLSEEQKDLLTKAMRFDGAGRIEDENFTWTAVRAALKAPQAWIMTIIFFPAGATLFAIAYFAPTVVQGLGYKGTSIQLMSVPPYASAFIFSVITSWMSDRVRMRGPFVAFWASIAMVGYAIWLGTNKTSVLYGALVLQVTGIYAIAGLFGAWNANNLAPSYKRSTGIVMGFISTNFGGILSTWLFPTTERPRYIRGTSVLLGLTVAMIALILCNSLWLANENRRKREASNQGYHDEHFGVGDRKISFKYMI